MLTTSTDHQVSYAVGDIHGRLDLLELALTLIEDHARGLKTRIVFLGDYVDRGPSSRQVVERLMRLQRDEGAVCLKGNHEDLMVRAFTESRSRDFSRWRACGSESTLRSYGASDDADAMAVVPRDHIHWLARLPLTTADPRRLYVHAGLMPNTPFRDQSETTFLWVREAFLRARSKDFELHIVHAHTPLWEGKPDASLPELLSHRTNLDTAAFASGVLTVGVFEPASAGGPVDILTARGEPAPYPLAEIVGPPEPNNQLAGARGPTFRAISAIRRGRE